MNIKAQAAIVLLARRVESTRARQFSVHPDMRPLLQRDAEREALQAERVAINARAFDAMKVAA